MLWQKTYGTEQKDILTSAVVSRDSSSILLAGNNLYGQWDSIRLCFMLIDTDGNELWRTNFRFSEVDEVHAVCQAEDDGFYFTASRLVGTRNQAKYYPLIGKLDHEGNISWMKTLYVDSIPIDFPENKFWLGYAAHSILVLSNGDLLITGDNYSWNINHNDGFVARFTADGNFIWRYDYRTADHDHLYSSIEDEQGYIYASGNVLHTPYDRDLLIVKLDANGCVIDTCLMPELPISPAPISNNSLFPNPFTNTLNIQCYNSTIGSEVIICNVYNSIGQIIQRSSWTSTSTPASINTSNWTQGFYIVELQANGLVERLKAVKQ